MSAYGIFNSRADAFYHAVRSCHTTMKLVIEKDGRAWCGPWDGGRIIRRCSYGAYDYVETDAGHRCQLVLNPDENVPYQREARYHMLLKGIMWCGDRYIDVKTGKEVEQGH
jgi:hypothetical protein